ncbi:hypothetical protein H8B09_24700 [Paenibacillus sp. PR3]|uniref:Uncharacterized protein n=2 Tax=Paenibacillus terricola TaxID=2763503 RepID=A0ABR8N283_9BACL|nr:hypothetical protein [Paenibacillus terricola]
MPHQRFQSSSINPRYPKGKISVFGINSVYPRPPWIAAWWAASFPGFGHMFIGKYFYGFVLVIWELVINSKANINMAIALSFLGRFDEAREILNEDWALMYVGVYVYSIWDSYRCAVEINKSHKLSEIEDAPITPSEVSFFDVIVLDKKHPWLGLVWSVISPGLGQLYGGSTIIGTFILGWWIFVCYKAVAIRSWLYSFLGDFSSAAAIVDWHWYLFLPSIYSFAIYQAYSSVNENNTLFDIEQVRYLRARADHLAQQHPADDVQNTVQIIATFEHSPFVEMAIHDLEKLGVPPHRVVAMPVENLVTDTHIIDSIHQVDGRSILDGAMMSAAIFSILGTIYGFVWYLGPIIWGLIGMVGGFLIGLTIELLFTKGKFRFTSRRKAEVIIKVTCQVSLQHQLLHILKARKASGFVIMPQMSESV